MPAWKFKALGLSAMPLAQQPSDILIGEFQTVKVRVVRYAPGTGNRENVSVTKETDWQPVNYEHF